jgi:hypothetical protein
MTSLLITDIRESCYNSGFDLITAIFLSEEYYDAIRITSFIERCGFSLLFLESATAEEELPAIGVRRGDHFLRMRANPNHGLKVGEEIRF